MYVHGVLGQSTGLSDLRGIHVFDESEQEDGSLPLR
jgi:hypothetical protein